ncbi:hypothetical protein EMIT047CA2_50194 [Pseudomonas soli]
MSVLALRSVAGMSSVDGEAGGGEQKARQGGFERSVIREHGHYATPVHGGVLVRGKQKSFPLPGNGL